MELYLLCVLICDGYIEIFFEKLNVIVLYFVLLYLLCVWIFGRCRDLGSLCWCWLLFCIGNCRKFFMIRYGFVFFFCIEEKIKMYFNYVYYMSKRNFNGYWGFFIIL